MKKSVILAILGVAASVATSYGQGYIKFSSYAQPISNLVTIQSNGNPITLAQNTFAELYFALGTVSAAPGNGVPPAGFTLIPTSSNGTYPSQVGNPGPGFFDGAQCIVPGYSGGPITFDVYCLGGYTGSSGSFTMAAGIRTDGVYSTFGDGGSGSMPAFTVVPTPEPTTLALAGLGGLASLVALRRKKA